VDALARQGLSSPFLGLEPANSVSPSISRLKVMDWLKERHCEHRAAAPGMEQSKLFFERCQINCLRTYWPWTGKSVGL
jgi:hypothetical protein